MIQLSHSCCHNWVTQHCLRNRNGTFTSGQLKWLLTLWNSILLLWSQLVWNSFKSTCLYVGKFELLKMCRSHIQALCSLCRLSVPYSTVAGHGCCISVHTSVSCPFSSSSLSFCCVCPFSWPSRTFVGAGTYDIVDRVSNLTYGHKLWVVTDRTRSQIQATTMMEGLCLSAGQGTPSDGRSGQGEEVWVSLLKHWTLDKQMKMDRCGCSVHKQHLLYVFLE